MRLVEDHRIARRQQLGGAFVAQHHVGEEEMVIDHHQVGGQRLAARRENEAFLVLRAVLSQAIVARRGHQPPHRRVLGDVAAIGFVAGLAGLGETRDTLRVGGVLARDEAPVGQRVFEVIVADVVGAPLEQGDLDRRSQRLANGRDVASEKLVL